MRRTQSTFGGYLLGKFGLASSFRPGIPPSRNCMHKKTLRSSPFGVTLSAELDSLGD